MVLNEILKNQGWKKVNKDDGIKQFEFEDGRDTLKIYFSDKFDSEQTKLIKSKLWNEYYSRIFLYRNSKNNLLVWTNSQSPDIEGREYEEIPFDEKISPIEYWGKYIPKSPQNTVDKVLEESIVVVFTRLRKIGYSDDNAIAIILACTFIRFLEDRNLSDVNVSLIDSLKSRDETIKLFKEYNRLHNGELFKNEILYNINKDTCSLLSDFLKNRLNIQLSLFDFNFKYIPVELISNVYEKLLTEKLGITEKKKRGIAYTPPRLANYVTKEAFKQLKNKNYSKLKIADLSTGSGIFLVLCFRRLLKKIDKKNFDEKKKILENSIFGFDLDLSAINITKFSLYVELLENENRKLSDKNKFPILKNIKKQNTLNSLDHNSFFDLVIGNPPWRSQDSLSFFKIKDRDFSVDVKNKELSQIFTHISLEKIKEDGTLSLVLPTAIFYNLKSFDFRKSIFRKSILKSFVDFSALRSVLFSNSVEPCVLVAEKNSNKIKNNYTTIFSRALNKADYLYFNHVSGEINHINSDFLLSRNDSWQIAVRGGNIVAQFLERLNSDFFSLNKIPKEKINIGTGYQATSNGQKKTLSVNQSNDFSMPIYVVRKGEIMKMYTNLKKASKSHIEFNKAFYKECIGVGNSYKYNNGLTVGYFPANKNRVLSGDFNIISSSDQDLLYFLLTFLSSRLGEFLISVTGTKTGLLSSEVKDPKIQSLDIKKLLIPRDYYSHKEVVKIGIKIAKKIEIDKQIVDHEIEKIFKLNSLEKKILDKWEVSTKRMDKNRDFFEKYKMGFEKMLSDYKLNKPKKWDLKEKNGVQIILFTGDDKFPSITGLSHERINGVMTAKNNFDFEFEGDDRCYILRRKDSNFGYLTGLSDAEYILSAL